MSVNFLLVFNIMKISFDKYKKKISHLYSLGLYFKLTLFFSTFETYILCLNLKTPSILEGPYLEVCQPSKACCKFYTLSLTPDDTSYFLLAQFSQAEPTFHSWFNRYKGVVMSKELDFSNHLLSYKALY